MRLLTPRTWYYRHGVSAAPRILTAASWIWAWATARRISRGSGFDPGVPVICIGNLTLGGAGKTPVARALAHMLRTRGVAAHVLMGGHDGRLRTPTLVDPAHHSARDTGDEALMIASETPVWVARDRAASARAAVVAGAQVLILDDGHQNPALTKTVSILVVDGETRDGEWPFGDEAVFPAGPMREPFSAGLTRADAVVLLLPADLPEPDPNLVRLFAGLDVLIARLEPPVPPPAGRQLAFAGIGKPWKMERALRAAGCDLARFVALPDHAPLSETTLQGLARQAAALGAGLLTSEKDWARLPPAWRPRIVAWPVVVRFEEPQALVRLLAQALGAG